MLLCPAPSCSCAYLPALAISPPSPSRVPPPFRLPLPPPHTHTLTPDTHLVLPPSSFPSLPPPCSVDEGSHLDPTDQRVYLVNCLFVLASPLAGHECALAQAQQLQ